MSRYTTTVETSIVDTGAGAAPGERFAGAIVVRAPRLTRLAFSTCEGRREMRARLEALRARRAAQEQAEQEAYRRAFGVYSRQHEG